MRERIQKERQLLSILDTSYDLVAIADPKSLQVTYLNPMGRRMLGLGIDHTMDELLVGDCFAHPESAPVLSLALQSAREKGVWSGEIVLGRKEMPGTHVWLQIQSHAAEEAAEAYLTLVAHDISKAKAQQSRLTRLSRALEQSPVAIMITDTSANIEYVNPRFFQITGYTLEEVVGKNPRILSAGQTPASTYKGMWETLSQGGEWHGEFLNRHKTGALIWARASISCIVGEEGETTHYLGVIVDITEVKHAAAALALEQQLMGALMDSVPDAIYFKDLQNRFIRINRAMAKRFRLEDPSLAEGKTDFDFFSEEHARQAFADELNIIRTGVPIVGMEEKETWPDRPPTWVSTTKMPLRNENQEIVGTFGISFDITRRKKAEEERSQLQAQLHQAQKLESIGQLAAGIAHEINTPTQYVSDNIQFVQKAFTDLGTLVEAHTALARQLRKGGHAEPEVEDILARTAKIRSAYLMKEVPLAIADAMEGLERVTKIVRAMKQFSHPGSDEMIPSDINRAIESTVTVSRNEWKYVAELVTELDPALPLVPCLPGEFNQVILNLVVNAAHAIGDKVGDGSKAKGLITIRTRLLAEVAEISISDTGTGIPEQVRPHIFEQFFTTKEVGRGTGQGLALARGIIVEQHGGTLHFETQTGQGTTFVIRLPLKAAR
jgi:PAS domain S-box-containing protein